MAERRELLANPFRDHSLLPSLTFSWVNTLLRKRGDLGPDDAPLLWELTEGDTCARTHTEVASAWRATVARGRPSIAWAFVSAFWQQYGVWSLALLVKAAAALGGVRFLALLLDDTATHTRSRAAGAPEEAGLLTRTYMWALGFVLCTIVQTSLHHVYFFAAWRAGMRWRSAAAGLIMAKALRMRADAAVPGHVMALVTTDVERFQKACQYLPYIVIAPVEAAVTIGLLADELGVSMLAGVAVLLVLVTVQSMLSKFLGNMRSCVARVSDERISLTSQVIVGARVLKLYAWEPPFAALVQRVRSREVQALRKSALVRGINEGLFVVVPLLVGAATFLTFHALGNVLTARRLFVSLLLYSFMQIELTKFFTMGMESLAELKVALRRMQLYLQLPESVVEEQAASATGDVVVMDHLTCAWAVPSAAGSSSSGKVARGSSNGKAAPATDGSAADVTRLPLAVRDVSLTVPRGGLCCVVGAVGSGKTSLLLAIMKELDPISGSVACYGKIAYVSQAPWIMTGTVRENITFGLPFDAQRYEQVIAACSLGQDLRLLSHGDATVIGERGINLSGGQKARVALARACYMDADVYLLDDPLSAVDARVARELFEKCVCGFLQSKTRILVTHQLQFLRVAHDVVVLEKGGVLCRGTFSQLSGMMHQPGADPAPLDASSLDNRIGATLSELLQEFAREEAEAAAEAAAAAAAAVGLEHIDVDGEGDDHGEDSGSQISGLDALELTSGAGAETLDTIVRAQASRRSSAVRSTASTAKARATDASAAAAPGAASIVQKEAVTTGKVQGNVYARYWYAAGGSLTMLYHALLLNGGIVVIILSGVALAQWANARPEDQSQPRFRAMYGGLVAGALLLSLWRSIAFFQACIGAAQRLHNDAFQRVLCAPMEFFDSNPAGRILNRFAKDVGLLDDALPQVYFDFLNNACNTLGCLALVAAINPWLLIPAVVLTIAFFRLRSYYLLTSRVVKRVESISRSPVMAILHEALSGLTVIRAFGMQDVIMQRFLTAQDANTRAFFAFLATSRWFGIRLDAMCLALLICATFASVALRDTVSAPFIGLTLTTLSMLTGAFQWTVRQSAETENLMIAAERVLEYAALPVEDVSITLGERPRMPDGRAEWPTAGAVSFSRVWMRYRADLPYVLRGVSFEVAPGQKVGVVGRTGAGKSSLFLAMLRLVESDRRAPAANSSQSDAHCAIDVHDSAFAGAETGIAIDGVDIEHAHLSALRRACSVIPQDPVLYAGTIRTNLDPFNEHTDDDVLEALRRVELFEYVSTHGGLALHVAESGSSLSVGQRQLVCLARAILRRTKVLLVDECTANVDMDTDKAIQRAVRTAFADATVITIAHRLATIIDCDRVLFMEAGEAKEFGHPFLLLQPPAEAASQGCVHGGRFRQLVLETGDRMAALLQRDAETAYGATHWK